MPRTIDDLVEEIIAAIASTDTTDEEVQRALHAILDAARARKMGGGRAAN